MNHRQKNELKTLAENLHWVPDEKFDMTTWGRGTLDPTTADFGCNYAGCAIGWAPKLIPGCRLELRSEPGCLTIEPHFNGSVGFGAVGEYFGLTEAEATHLFYPNCYDEDDELDESGEVTKEAVARRILDFLEHGLPPTAVDDDGDKDYY